MKLYAIVPNSVFERSDLAREERLEQYELENSAILNHLAAWLELVGEVKWRVTYKEVWKDVHPPTGDLTNAQVIAVIKNCLEGLYWAVLRDDTCRFLRTGQDGDVKFCVHSEDSVPELTSPLIVLRNMSPRLIDNEGFFDL